MILQTQERDVSIQSYTQRRLLLARVEYYNTDLCLTETEDLAEHAGLDQALYWLGRLAASASSLAAPLSPLL